MKRLLLIEDEDVIVKALKRLLERNHYVVEVASTVEQAIARHPTTFDLILADLRLPGAEGTSIIPEADPVPVVIMTSHASVRSAVDAMRHGAIDYIAKPFDHDELLMVISRALTQNLLQVQNQALRLDVKRLCKPSEPVPGTVLESLSESMSALKDSERCAHLIGEHGSGREALARAVHARGPRQDAPFLIADMLMQSPDQNAAVLFGDITKPGNDDLPPGGYLQGAQNGTLALCHPERLSIDTQQLLAEVLAVGSVRNPTSGKQQAINIRTITISDTSIESLLAQGHLCEELGCLFRQHQFEIPPLRTRASDIIAIANFRLQFLEQRFGHNKLKLSEQAQWALLSHQWPGNEAELNSLLTRAAFVSRTGALGLEELGFNADALTARDLSLDEYFRYVVMRNQSELSETELATRLGISRKALWERRQKMNILRNGRDEL